jgi:hypothetical protein
VSDLTVGVRDGSSVEQGAGGLGMVAHACNPSMGEEEAGGL